MASVFGLCSFGIFLLQLMELISARQEMCDVNRRIVYLSHDGEKSTKRIHASFLEACGHVYYFSNLKVRCAMIKEECRMVKMLPLTLEDKKERPCFARNAKAHLKEAEFWISAVRENQPEGNSAWCLEKSQQPLDLNATDLQVTLLEDGSRISYIFHPDAGYGPETNETRREEISCFYVSDLTDETVGLKEEISNGGTWEEKYTFVCKLKVDDYLDVVALADYSQLSRCVSNPKKLATVQESVAKMQAANLKFLPLADGSIFHLACSKIFFITPEGFSWKEGMKECCKYGLSPLKIESKEHFQCLYKAMNDSGDFSVFWTSGHNPNKEDQFQWIDSSKVENISWALNQPDKPQEFKCVSVAFQEFDTALSGLQNSKCFAPLPVICQKDI